MTITRSKFSERQAGKNVAVNVHAQSPQARMIPIVLDSSAAMVVQASTKYMTCAPVQNPSSTSGFRVVGAALSFQTAPAVAGGTATIQVDAIASDGSTTTNIVPSTSILGLTSKVATQLALAAAQVADSNNGIAIPVGATILVTVTTSNNSVGTADVGFGLTIGIEPVEDTIINDANLNTAQG